MSENGTDPTSKVLDFFRRLFKEAAPLPESKHRGYRTILGVHSLKFGGYNLARFIIFRLIAVIFLLQVWSFMHTGGEENLNGRDFIFLGQCMRGVATL